ncbi:MAG: gluconokinase [Bacteroidota bacterium]
MSTSYTIGLDLGTTAVKACAFTDDGELLAQADQSYALRHPEPGAAVQDPEEVLTAAAEGLRVVIQEMNGPPAGIGLCTAMHSLLLLSADYTPVSPIITWADTRAQAIMNDFTQKQKRALLRRTGTPVHPMSPLVKLRYLHATQDASRKRMHYVSDLKSYLVHQWTQDGLCLDSSLVSATGLYGLKPQSWDQEALQLAKITEAALPKVLSPTTRLRWRTEVMEQLGISTDVPLVIGGSDGCLANLGSKLQPGEIALSIGTSGAVRTTHQGVEVDPSLGLFNYHIKGTDYALGGATNNGGKVIEWLFDLLDHPYQSIGEMLGAAAAVDTEGLSFVPHIYGERAPIYDAAASGSFTGVRSHHQPAQYARAAVEGVTDNIITILRSLEVVTGPASRIIASGGFTASPFWLDLIAKKSGRAVVVADTAQASAYGAALLVMGR